jgi:hypothetical protein
MLMLREKKMTFYQALEYVIRKSVEDFLENACNTVS